MPLATVHFFWNGSRVICLLRSASEVGSTCDNCENPSSSTKQISSSFGSDKMITRTVALPGVSNEVNGWITLAFCLMTSSFNFVCSSNGMAKAMRPNAVLRSIGTSKFENGIQSINWNAWKWNSVKKSFQENFLVLLTSFLEDQLGLLAFVCQFKFTITLIHQLHLQQVSPVRFCLLQIVRIDNDTLDWISTAWFGRISDVKCVTVWWFQNKNIIFLYKWIVLLFNTVNDASGLNADTIEIVSWKLSKSLKNSRENPFFFSQIT